MRDDPRSIRIEKRPVPQWWQDSRFGIFIHWGPYSVPAYAENDYSEWYWNHVQTKPGTRAFHERVYGKDFGYADFFPQFRAELFDPGEWARLFERSGARYVVLTAKHNDGFCLWPSPEASKSRGRPWNSVETGPRRDLVGELSEAVTATGLRMGLYFLLYEWDHPAYLRRPSEFIEQVSIPQIQDLVKRYNPWILWTDGGWQHGADEYRSLEVLDWMITHSDRGDAFVFNDRWGHPLEGRMGHLTTEYTYAIDSHKYGRPWEETRGMGTSFAYNRRERLEDYATSEELILTLVDVISHGGNLLLDIGPQADGIIPLFMQERLLAIGSWLRVNGEAVYGSRPWVRPCNWSEGRNPLAGFTEKMEAIKDGIAQRLAILEQFDIRKLILEPDAGNARKEWLFTQSGGFLYAFHPGVPRRDLMLKGVVAAEDASIRILGWDQPIGWTQQGADLHLHLPEGLVETVGWSPVFVFRIPLPPATGE